MEYQYTYQPRPVYDPQPAYVPTYTCPPPPVAQSPYADWEYPYPSQSAYQPQPVYAPQPAYTPQYVCPSPPIAQDPFASANITALDLALEPADDGASFTAMTSLPPMHSSNHQLPAAEITQVLPTITNKQLRALSRKHLYIMIRDQERELRRAKERESLLMDFHAWLPQAQLSYGV